MINEKKLHKKILRLTGQAVAAYKLIEHGDRIMLALSGGKDSLSLLYILRELQKKAPISFDLFVYNLYQGQPDFLIDQVKKYVQELGIENYFETQDTYALMADKLQEREAHCSLCARFRRGILYTEAIRLKANKIALGHHCDDAMETLLLNLFYSGRLAGMAPILQSDDKKNIIIRPFIFLTEADIRRFAEYMAFPVTDCGSCKINANKQRARVKELLERQAQENPLLRSSMRKAMRNLQPRHLADENFFDFANFSVKKSCKSQMDNE